MNLIIPLLIIYAVAMVVATAIQYATGELQINSPLENIKEIVGSASFLTFMFILISVGLAL